MPAAELTAAAAALVDRSRKAQGLPAEVQDPAVLSTVARVLAGIRGAVR